MRSTGVRRPLEFGDNGIRGSTKERIVRELSARLKESEAFQGAALARDSEAELLVKGDPDLRMTGLPELFGAVLDGSKPPSELMTAVMENPVAARTLESRFDSARHELANSMIRGWADTSADESVDAVVMQKAVQEEFGLSDAKTDHFPKDPRYIRDMSAERAFVRAMYENTQKELADAGVERVTLMRGMHVEQALSSERDTTVQLQPASSFSSSPEIALGFATPVSRHPVVIGISVPRSRILATAGTGFGCLKEREFVVLGGEVRARVLSVRESSPLKLRNYMFLDVEATS